MLRLVSEGLVTKCPPKHGRGKVLPISGQGRRLRQRMWKVYGSLIEEYVGGLASNRDPVARVLNALVE